MRLLKVIVLLLLCATVSCSKNDEVVLNNLAEILESKSHLEQDEVIACAANKQNDTSVSHIYYYPIPGAENIQYFETPNTNVDPNDFSNYQLRSLGTEDVYGGYLERFVRLGQEEVYCIVTFETNGKFHRSNPIRLKNASKPTEYTTTIDIDFSQPLMPIFTWEDGAIQENAIYFQVISDMNNSFMSGTYTFEKSFQYYNLDNVVLHINRENPVALVSNQTYNFSMLAVSIDNWVNLIIETPFTTQ